MTSQISNFININSFSEEYKVIRNVTLMYSQNEELRYIGYKTIIQAAEKLKWAYFLDEICLQLKNDGVIYRKLEKSLPENIHKNFSLISDSIDTYESFFTTINSKDLQSESVKVKEYAKNYYDFGCFSQYISVFNRFIVYIKNDFPEPELHQYIVRYVIACIVKRQLDLAISEITKLKHAYNLYDISIYVFLLKVLNGKFLLAEEEILSISNNIFPEVYEKLIDKDSLFFYIILIMFVCFKKQMISTVQTTSGCYAYKLLENSPEKFNIIFNYSKCRFSSICKEFNTQIVGQISLDYILSQFKQKLIEDFKENIIIQLVTSSVSIPIKVLSEIVYEDTYFVERIVVNLITSGKINSKIDKVNNVIISLDLTVPYLTYKKAFNFSEKTYFLALKGLISKSNTYGYELPNTKDFKTYDLSDEKRIIRKKITGGGGFDFMKQHHNDDDNDYDEDHDNFEEGI